MIPNLYMGDGWKSPCPSVIKWLFQVPGIYSGQIIATSAEVTPNGGLERESSHNPLNSGLGIIVIFPDIYIYIHIHIVYCSA